MPDLPRSLDRVERPDTRISRARPFPSPGPSPGATASATERSPEPLQTKGSVQGSILSETQSHPEQLKPLWNAESGLRAPRSSDLITRRSRVRIPPPLLQKARDCRSFAFQAARYSAYIRTRDRHEANPLV